MLKDLFSNRLFIGALAFFILCMVGGTLYIGYVEKQEGAMELAEAEERIKQLTSKQQQPTAETEPIEGKIHRRPFSEMPPEERLKAVEDWYRQSGLELPPDTTCVS